MTAYEMALALNEHFERLAEMLCNCRGPGNREPFKLEFHSDTCIFKRTVEPL